MCVDTPWDEPTQNSAEFCAFVDGTLLEMDPWSRIRGGTLGKIFSLSLSFFLPSYSSSPTSIYFTRRIIDCLLKLLELNPSKRITISQLESLDWFTQYVPSHPPSLLSLKLMQSDIGKIFLGIIHYLIRRRDCVRVGLKFLGDSLVD